MRKRTTSNIVHKMKGEFTVKDVVKKHKQDVKKVTATVQYLKRKGEIIPVSTMKTEGRGRPAIVYKVAEK